mmetsp:Transcript_35508/g.76662  ORF Transcript_35508/g.76662 Transcript_35508/m.76662 type:complete len:358 (+) Transcript_35508:135-1208(+)
MLVAQNAAGPMSPGSPGLSDVSMTYPESPFAGEVSLSDQLLARLAVGKVYRDHKGSLTGLDFTYDGQHLVTSGEDNSVFVYSVESAHRSRHLRCEKYGCGLVRFLHNDKEAAVAATRNSAEHMLKYWDFHENKYLRFFRGHKAPITSLCPHPYEDVFLTGAQDKTVMMWDLRADKPNARIDGAGPCVAGFDQQGMVFAASVGSPKLHLFDTRNFSRGEFICFDISAHLSPDNLLVHSVQFSPCGRFLLVRTLSQLILLDAFDGTLLVEYPIAAPAGSPEALPARPSLPSFSPDSKYVMSGVSGGGTCIWQTTTGRLIQRLSGHTTQPTHVAFSPAHALAVTAAESCAWWIPEEGSQP